MCKEGEMSLISALREAELTEGICWERVMSSHHWRCVQCCHFSSLLSAAVLLVFLVLCCWLELEQ